jgi:hypothetical protein
MSDTVKGAVRLYDRADGVRGHFCIGREVIPASGLRYHEFWNAGRFCSAGQVYVGETAAKKKLIEIVQRLAERGD